MKYSYEVELVQGTYVKTYVAEIMGPDPTYRFKRRFLRKTSRCRINNRKYIFDLGGHGVFEQSVKRYKSDTDKLFSRERRWFVYYRRRFYEINYDEVLFCVYNLKAQYWRWPDLPKTDAQISRLLRHHPNI